VVATRKRYLAVVPFRPCRSFEILRIGRFPSLQVMRPRSMARAASGSPGVPAAAVAAVGFGAGGGGDGSSFERHISALDAECLSAKQTLQLTSPSHSTYLIGP